ncbi:MAG: L,D-transpeptidase [Actinomycetota bacterium]|nr:L,D-transpeptidase [Actinomycetota bacterium]
MLRTRTVAAVVVALATAVGAAVVLDVFGGTSRAPAARDDRAAALPDPVAPAFTPTVKPVASGEELSRWAPVVKAVKARRGPHHRAPVIAPLETTTPEGTTNIVLVLPDLREVGSRVWVRVRLPVLPNNTTGWVPRDALGGYSEVRTRLVVDRADLTATLFLGGREVFSAPVGIGEARWPTPRGEFYVRNRLTHFNDPAYGPIAFGTSARSSVLTDWPAGGFIGIHGTNQPDLLPGRVSHGCIRMRNDDIVRLDRLMPVGTPLTIR